MGYHNQGLTHFLSGLQKEFQNLVRVGTVQVTGGLVGKYDIGHVDQRTRNGNSLLLTAGKLGGQVMQTLGKLQGLNQTAECFLIGKLCLVAHHGGNQNVFKSGKLRNQVVSLENEAAGCTSETAQLIRVHLGDVGTADQNTSCISGVKSRADVKECTLTGTGCTDDRNKFTRLYLNTRTVYSRNDCVVLFVLLNDTFGLKHIFCHNYILRITNI